MALERVGIGGVFTFKSKQAVRSMNQARDASGKFIKGQNAMKAGAGGMGAIFSKAAAGIGQAFGIIKGAISGAGKAIRGLGVKMLPLTLIAGLATKKAADFEQQMDTVGAISGAVGVEMERLESKAKLMGATTVFSATQSGQAMEFLARAGATTDEIISGLGGVMNAAAADSIDLATAADIVARVVKSMGLAFTDANKVADILALTSAKTNTDMVGLGEGFKFAAAQAASLKIDLETTSALLGVAADAGLRGSLGGTSFTNMLIKLTKPSGKATKFMKKFNITMTKTADGGLDIVDVLKQVNTALSKEGDIVKKSAMATELFGIRGAKAFNAISQGLKTGKLDALIGQLGNAQGKAEEMATRRLSNFKGQITLLKSAIEGLSIETMGVFLKSLSGNLKSVTKALGAVVQAITDIQKGVESGADLTKKYGKTTMAVARGIIEGLEMVKSVFATIKATVQDLVARVSGQATPEITQAIAKWGTALVLLGAAAAPFLIALGTVIIAVSGVLAFMILFATYTVGALFGIAGAVVGITAAFNVTRDEGQTFFDWFTGGVNNINRKLTWLRTTGFEPMTNYWQLEMLPAFQNMARKSMDSIGRLGVVVKGVLTDIGVAVEFLRPLFQAVFRDIQAAGNHAFGTVLVGAAKAATVAFQVTLGVLETLVKVIGFLGKAMVVSVVGPLQMIAKAIVLAADAVDYTISDKLRSFADKKLVFGGPEDTGAAVTRNIGAGSNFLPKISGGGGAVREISSADLAKAIAASAGARSRAQANDPCVDVSISDKRKVEVDTKLILDGDELARSFAKTQVELQDRRGFRATPWQRRITLEHGATPVTRTS